MRVLSIGAHPDDCEIKFGGTAAKFARSGHAVKFVSVTDGSSGHQSKPGPELARIRKRESERAAKCLGIDATEVLSNPDGSLQPTLNVRWQIIRQIREWNADLVFTHRGCDYHPDHRYTSQVVQDAAYLVMVPTICPETPPLKTNPVFLYFEDAFQLPHPFRRDLTVGIDDVWSTKLLGMDAHASQFYEWLPWIEGILHEVPGDADIRMEWLSRKWSTQLSHAEAFQLCEYGHQPSQSELREMFPC